MPASWTGPIFGFFGLIEFWIDRELITEVARLRPNYKFVMIGDCRVDVSALRKLPNVHFLGRKSNDMLPAYCSTFNAGLLPFVNDAMTKNVNPIKMYEYLAAGLPVVSTPMPEASRFEGPIRMADSPQRFAEACDEVLASDFSGRRRQISSVVENESWLSKVQLLSDIVTERLLGPVQAASMPIDAVAPRMTTTAQTWGGTSSGRAVDCGTVGESSRGV